MSTLDYYRNHAQDFSDGTVAVDFSITQERFLRYLQPGACILDFGCGSGRDSRCFAERGYAVTATDGCAELVELARAHTGLHVRLELFQELEDVELYDGIWACASILHLPPEELVEVLGRLHRALKRGGYLYTSFKYGDFAGESRGRYFTYLTEHSLTELLAGAPEFEPVEQWVSGDVRPGREGELWLNVILRRPL